MLRTVVVLILAGMLVGCGDNGAQPNQPDMDYVGNAQRWIADEFQPSTLSEAEQTAEADT